LAHNVGMVGGGGGRSGSCYEAARGASCSYEMLRHLCRRRHRASRHVGQDISGAQLAGGEALH
jgi:hypothetical protein